jgi:hypothetical protein
MKRQPYPTDVSDDEWAFVASYLTLIEKMRRSESMKCAKSVQDMEVTDNSRASGETE